MRRLVARSISARILVVAALNLCPLVVIALLASGVRLPRGLRDLLVQSATPRLLDLSREVALDLARTPPGEVEALLRQYSERHGAEFVLALNTGERVAGALPVIPGEVVAAVTSRGSEAERSPPRGKPRIVPAGDRRSAPGATRVPLAPPFLVMTAGSPRYWIGLRIPVQFAGDTTRAPGTLLLASSSLLGNGLLVPWAWLGWASLALAVTVACWWPLLRGITTSLRQLERATEGMASGRFDAGPGLARADELGRLSAAMARMGARLGTLLSGQKRFLGDTAHELRSPLGRMQVALGILDARVNDSERGYVRDLQEDVEALSSLTDELLQFARAEFGTRPTEPSPVPVAATARRVAEREGAGASLQVTVPESLQVLAQAALFERALANVVRNAVRYAADAGPIEVAARAEGAWAVVTVRDAGPGVPREAVDRLFEPFFRLDAARTRRTGGAGLGLAIVRSAIEASGGRVSCRNLEPAGFEVRIDLPQA